ITLKAGQRVSEQAIMRFCREHLAGLTVPKDVVLIALPTTSTGKIQKYVLREWASQRQASCSAEHLNTPQPALRGAGRPIAVPRQHFLFHNNNKPTSVRPGAPALHPAFGQRSVYMQVYKRAHGAEQPHWPCGPFKIRLPFIHCRWEAAEM